MKGLDTDYRRAQRSARERQTQDLLSLGWKQLANGYWQREGSQFTYPIATAICLAKLRGEIKSRGHSWAL